jgi:shikimate kinase
MEIKRIFLIGFMGSGKTTLGRNLANAMKWRFVDLDHCVEEKAGMSVSSIFSTRGEPAFRELERDALSDLLMEENVVVSTGGGTPCFFDNIERMNQSGLTIYLKLSAEILGQRLEHGKQIRPLVAHKSASEIRDYINDKLAERSLFYEKSKIVADAEVLSTEGYLTIIKTTQALG